MISYLIKLIGTSALLALAVIYVSEHAHASPVKVEFSGHLTSLDPILALAFPGNAIYETEITSEIPEGSHFFGSFIYDPLAPATTYPLGAPSTGYGLGYDGLISSLTFQLERAGGGYFSSTASGGMTVANDQPSGAGPYGPTYSDIVLISLDILSPEFPGIPAATGGVGMWAALNFFQSILDPATSGLPDMLSSYSPPLDLAGVTSRSTSRAVAFYMDAADGFIGFSGAIDEITVSSVPAPAPIGLFVLGLGYIARRRLKA